MLTKLPPAFLAERKIRMRHQFIRLQLEEHNRVMAEKIMDAITANNQISEKKSILAVIEGVLNED